MILWGFDLKKIITVSAACLLFLLIASGCSNIILNSAGRIDDNIDTVEEYRDDLSEYLDEIGIMPDEIYLIRNEYYSEYIAFLEDEFESFDLSCYKQPLQIVYFDTGKHHISFTASNTVGMKFPFVSMKPKWNQNGVFDTFPPGTAPHKPYDLKKEENEKKRVRVEVKDENYGSDFPDIRLNKDSILTHIEKLIPGNREDDISEYDYTVFMFGCIKNLRKGTKSMTQTVHRNISLDSNRRKIKKIFLINPKDDFADTLRQILMP